MAERKDVLSTFFGLLALLAYARYAEPSPVPRSASKIYYGASLGAFALALLAKPMLVTLPFVLLLLDYWPLRRWPGSSLRESARRLREKSPFFLLAALSCVVTLLAQHQNAIVSLRHYGFGLRLENAIVAWAGYCFQTLWPVNLCVFYALPKHVTAIQVALPLAALITITLLAWRARQYDRCYWTGWLWFLGMLMPVIGLVQVGSQAMADRYTYLPIVGLFAAAAFGLARAREQWKIPARIAALAAILVLGACVAVTEHQLTFWRDTETLFTRALAVTRENGPAHMMLGVALERQGRTDAALEQYQAALAIDPTILVQLAGGGNLPIAAQVQMLRGLSAEQHGRGTDALAYYRKALRLDPSLVEAHNSLGNLLDQQGHPDAALEQYQATVRLRPGLPQTHENLGTQLVEMGRYDEALAEYQTAARLSPADPRPFYLAGRAWLRRGDHSKAVAALQNALRLAPSDSVSLVFLARLLASDESPQIRNGDQAVALAEKANALMDGRQPVVLGTLAMAYAEAGRFAEARQTVQTALSLATGDQGVTSNLQAQLQLYEAGHPFRDSFAPPPPPSPPHARPHPPDPK